MKRSLYLVLFSLVLSVGTLGAANLYDFTAVAAGIAPDGVAGNSAIQTQPLSSTTFCVGSSIVVEYATSGSGFDGTTVYSVELSDAGGSFASPTVLPQLPYPSNYFQNGTYIYVQIPGTVAPGTGYRLRVVSQSPVILGADNGLDITITDESALTAPLLEVNGAQIFCFGTASTFIVSDATSGNLWFPGGTNTNPFIGAVLSGNYFTQISTSSGCATNSAAATIQANSPVFGFLAYFENGQLASTSDTTVSICEGDSLQIGVIIEGGQPPFDIVYTPDGFNFEFVNDVGVPYADNTFVYTQFVSDPGIYQLIGVTDAFIPPCNSQGSAGTVIVQLVPPPVTSFSYEPFCGSESGVPVAAPGFLGGGVYSFDPLPTDGATISASTGVLSGTVIGNSYTVRYTVSEGSCTDASSTTSLTVNSSDVVSFTINPFCEGADSGFPITAPGFEGGGSYAFNPAVTDGATINTVTGIISGAAGATTYIVQYTSPAGACQANSSTSVTTIDAPEIAISVINATCGNADGSLDATVTEGSAPYSFTWSNGVTTEDISGIEAGAYTLTVTDAQGCETESAATIINQNQPELVFNSTNATCGSDNGSINLTINNGVGPYSIVWSPGGETTEDISGLGGGTYSAVVTDLSTTCEVSGSATILFQGAPTATFTAENTLCGQSVGSIDLNVSGGTAPITHNWSNGATTEDILGLGVGVYTDTITDANGCFTIVSVNIVNGNQFTLSASVVNPTCSSQNGGSIDLTVNGGDAPFLFSWTPNTTTVTEDVIGLAAGDYTVVVTDNAGCIDSLTSTLLPTLPLELTGVTTDATCSNSDGGVNISVNGGSGSYTFVWDNSAVTEDLTNVAAGTYTVIVGDQADVNCTTSGTFTVVNGNQPEVTLTSTNTSCADNTGSVSLTITGGSGNFTYAWSGPDGFTSNSENLTNLAAGQYSVAVTDNETTCLVNVSIEVAPANAPTYTSTVVQTSCGQSNGIIDIEVTGGTEPFVVTWNGVSSSLDQTNLSAGSYAFLLTDANNCQLSETFTINPSVAPSIASEFLNPACGNDTGSVNVTLTDALSPIVFNWTKDGVDFASSEDISSLSPGNYELLATDAAGCVVSASFNLVYQNQPTLSFTSESTLCGASTGSIDLLVEGGTAPFVFEWSGPNGFSASIEDISNLAGGCYTVVLSDAATCEVTLEACVANSNAPEIVFSTVQPSCGENNGIISPVISEGQAPYTFAWSGAEFSVDSLIDNLGNGNYILTVTDASGCESIDSVSLVNTGVPIVTGDVNDPVCGVNDGSITAVVTGGLAPYSFLWSPSGSADATISGLGVGTYTVLVTDAAGCEATGQFTLENFNGPEIASSFTNTLCGENDGSIDITVTEGSGDYSFIWTGAGVDVASEDQNGLAAGAYLVLVTDNLTGCEATSTIEIENSNQPILTLISVGTLCGANSGSVALTVTNALNPTFSWTGPNGFTATTEDISNLSAGIYSITVTDGACEATGSVSVSPTKSVWSQNVTLVAGGQYNFQVFAQNVIASSPAQLRVFVGSANLGAFTPTGNITWTQFSASFTATTSGLTEVKIVNENLSPSGNDFGIDDISLVQVCPVIPPPGSTCGTNIIVNGGFESGNTGFLSQYTFVANGPANNELIPEGTYGIAANANTMHPQFQGTGRSGNFMIINGNEPENPVLSFSTVGATCSTNNGSVNLTVTNFTIPISYAWSGPNGFAASSQDISGLAAGQYTVSVTSGACTQTGSATVGFTNLPTLALNAVPASCGNADGSVDLTITGATNPTVAWTGPDGFTASTEDISNLAEGLYNVTVTSGNCVVEDSIAVIVDQPQLAFNIVPSSCSGSDGSIDLTVTNSNSPSFSWSGPNGFTATTEDISSLAAGEYLVTVTDGECVVEGAATINSTAPVVTFITIQPSCNNDNGSIAPLVSGGQTPFAFAWSGNLVSTDSLLENLGAGTYDLTVTDVNGCEATASVTLNNTGVPSIVGTPTNPECGVDNGSISASISGGSLPYSILWSPGGATESTISNLGVGTYTIQVTDASGCETTSEFTLTNSNAPEITSVASNSTCGETSGEIDITVSNGSGDYTYVWSGNGVVANTEDQSGLGAGSYTVLVTDNSTGCEATTTVEIINSDAPLLTLITIGTLCGDNSGSINLTVTNAANPTFSWTGPNGFTATTEDISGLSTGVYSVTVTDGDCEATASATVSATKSVWSQNVNLVAGSQYDFQIFAQNVNPASPAQLRIYVGENTLGTFSPVGLAVWAEFSASFTATVTGLTEVKVVNESLASSGNDFGLDDISLIEVCPVSPPPGSTCGTNIIGNGAFESGNTGFLSQYTFVANGPSNNELIPAGTYSVAPNAAQLHPQFTGTGRSGNFMVINGNIPVNPVLSFATVGASCSANNGSINLSVANLTNPVSYAWTGPNGFTASTQDINNLAGGTYNVIVTSGGCTQSGSATVIFTNLPVLASVVTPADCQLSNGSIDLLVTNVTSPTIAWAGPDGFTATTEDIVNLAEGSYIVIVTQGTCVVSDTIEVITDEPILTIVSQPTSCSGSTGSIDLTVSNANNPTFSWTGPDGFAATTEDLSGLAAGIYNVTVSDGACVVEGSATVTSDEPTLAFNATPSSCGGTTGTIDLTITNGANPTFSWTGPDGFAATTEDLSGLAVGVYNVTVTDGACVVEGSATITSDEPTLAFNATPSSCGGTTGTIDLTVTNGANPTFSWTGPDGFASTTEDLSGLATGIYNVTVTDGACVVEGSATITSDEPTLAFNATPSSCGGTTGTIDLTVTNGANPTFSWTGPDGFAATTEDLSGLAAGVYNVTVTDGACVVQGSATVTSDEPTLAFNATPSSCGGTTGTIDLTVTNGANPTFSWTGPDGFAATTEDLSGLAAGVYNVTVTDGACVVEGSATIISNNPSVSLSSVPATCGLLNGSIDLTISNASNPSFSWTGPDGFTSTLEDLSALEAGLYTVTVTDGSCSVEESTTITSTGSAITATLTSTGTSCGLCNGSAEVTVTSGVGPFTYQWSSGASVSNPSTLCAGDAVVTITDPTGCSAEFTVSIAPSTAPVVTFTQTPSTCGNAEGSIDVSVADAVEPYVFVWNGPNVTGVATEDLTALEAGIYTLEFLDANLCSASISVTITNSNEPVVEVTATGTLCGQSTGAIDITVSNASSPSFSWTGPNGFAATTEDLTGLAAGDYSVTVTDGDCIVEETASVINTNGPTASIAAATATICPGADVELTISFTGTAPYTFTYTDGSTPVTIAGYDATQYVVTVSPTVSTTYTLTDVVSDSNPDCEGSFIVESVVISISTSPIAPSISADGPLGICEGQSVVLTSSAETGNIWNITGPDQFNQSITVTEEGSYFVVVLNEFGCTDTSNTLDVDVIPSGLELAFNDTTVCAGTSIQLIATDGDNYLWSPSVYLSTILNGTTTCTPFQTTTYIVTGSNACGEGSDTVTVTVNPIASTDLGSDLTLCQNTPLTLSVQFEDGVTYNWGPASAIIGQTDSSSAQINTIITTDVYLQTTNTNGCVFTDTLAVNIENPLASFNISALGATTFCQGDNVVLQATTGNLVVWSNGLENFDQIQVVEAGDYFAVYNGSNCPVYSDTISVSVTPLPAVAIVPQGSLTVCEGTCASLQASETSGITWTLADGSTSTEASIDACVNGWYILSRTENACTAVDSVFVTVTPAIQQPTVTLDGSNVICQGQSTSTLISSYATGNQWLLNGNPIDGATSNTLVLTVGGIYSVVVSSSSGCTSTSATVEIIQKSTDPIQITAADTVVCNNESINIVLTASPGFVSYTWFGNGEAGETYTATYIGEYSVVGINEDGCQSTDYINIVGNIPFEVEAVSPVYYDDFNVSYAGAQDGSIEVNVTGGSGSFSYSWSNGSTAEDLSGLSGGDYTLTVSDQQGCSVITTINVNEPGLIKLPNGFTPNGDGFNDFYVITGIQGYEGNQINIFNRWGSLVYSAKEYQNNWDGTSNDGNLLPDGTYFIVVNLNKEGYENVQSYIDIKRN